MSYLLRLTLIQYQIGRAKGSKKTIKEYLAVVLKELKDVKTK